MFRKLIQIMGIVLVLGALVAFPVQASSTYSISGNITWNGLGLKGVTVTIQGTSLSGVTDGLGNYSIHYVPAGSSGTLVPTLANYSFSPANISFTSLLATLTGKNFVATQISIIYHTISGQVTYNGVGLAGVKVSFSTFSTLTATNGTYAIINIPAGTKGRILPSLSGYAFTPAYISVSGLTSNLVNENFTASLVYTISGKVIDATTLLPVGGVTVTFGSYKAVSSSSTGAFTIRNIPAGTSGTLTPSLTGKTFSPASYAISNIQANLHGYSFSAAP